MIPDNCRLNMRTKIIACLKLTNIYSLYKQTSDQPHVLYCKLFYCKNVQANYYSILKGRVQCQRYIYVTSNKI